MRARACIQRVPPATDATVSAPHQLLKDLEQLADQRNTDRSAEFCAAAMWWINEAIEDGQLDRETKWNPSEFHAERRKIA